MILRSGDGSGLEPLLVDIADRAVECTPDLLVVAGEDVTSVLLITLDEDGVFSSCFSGG